MTTSHYCPTTALNADDSYFYGGNVLNAELLFCLEWRRSFLSVISGLPFVTFSLTYHSVSGWTKELLEALASKSSWCESESEAQTSRVSLWRLPPVPLSLPLSLKMDGQLDVKWCATPTQSWEMAQTTKWAGFELGFFPPLRYLWTPRDFVFMYPFFLSQFVKYFKCLNYVIFPP